MNYVEGGSEVQATGADFSTGIGNIRSSVRFLRLLVAVT